MSAQIIRFDPAKEAHIAISQTAEYYLRRIGDASSALATLFEAMDPERGSVDEAATAALFETISFAIEGALADKRTVFPKLPTDPKEKAK